MTQTHTPGPWSVNGQKSVRGPAGEYIAKANWNNGTANARLIAAAPELLAVAKAAMAFIKSHVADPDITQEMSDRYAELEALGPNEVIAKAEGR